MIAPVYNAMITRAMIAIHPRTLMFFPFLFRQHTDASNTQLYTLTLPDAFAWKAGTSRKNALVNTTSFDPSDVMLVL